MWRGFISDLAGCAQKALQTPWWYSQPSQRVETPGKAGIRTDAQDWRPGIDGGTGGDSEEGRDSGSCWRQAGMELLIHHLLPNPLGTPVSPQGASTRRSFPVSISGCQGNICAEFQEHQSFLRDSNIPCCSSSPVPPAPGLELSWEFPAGFSENSPWNKDKHPRT